MPLEMPQFNHSVPVTPSDTVDFPVASDALFVGGAGIVVVVWESGRTGSFTCTAGQILPFKAKRVNAASTTATLINALYRV